MKLADFLALAGAALAAGTLLPAAAHHSFEALYDGRALVTIDGTVREFEFANPHARVTVEVPDGQGGVRQWIVEIDGRRSLQNFGWTAATLLPGEHVRITGHPGRMGEPRMFFAKVVRGDGSEIVLGGNHLSSTGEAKHLRAVRRAAAP
ncbi:MAG TPA: DUF6152 family protein [Gammaproteobacteria bacterium]|jgi:hypothetical protein|nr:DUF6152 family protein [Gammaproteobacteria bacterium]